MANLRDRGYGNSMEGLQLKKAPERHTRQKNVAPGEASVSKGQKVTNTNVQNSSVMRMPSPDEIRASYGEPPVNAKSPQRSAPLNLQFSDVHDEGRHESNVEIPFQIFDIERDIGKNEMSLDEIRRRMRELERALSGAYARQNTDRAILQGAKKTTHPTGDARFLPKFYADYKWDEADFLGDWAPDLGNDAYAAFRDIERAKAAASGRALSMKAMDMAQTNKESQYAQHSQNVDLDEASIDNLFFEYNNLRNEYNARLAQYLQGLR